MTTTTNALIVLPHSGLRVPHTRLTVTGLRQMETSRGIAYTAKLLLDGRPVADVENQGNGGGTWPFFLDRRAYGDAEFDAFVKACRDATGEPVNSEQVLDALVDEHDYRKRLAQLAPMKRTLARLMDFFTNSDDQPFGAPWPQEERICPMPTSGGAREAVIEQLGRFDRSPHGFWELWTGERWERLIEPAGAAKS